MHMMSTDGNFDVIVIGAGVEGSATAYQLTKLTKEKRIALVEQFDAHHTRGSSHGGSRITRRAYPEEFYTAMMQEAFPLWKQLERESGRKVFICTGGMFFGPSDSGAVKSVRDTLSKQKIPHEVLKAEDANKRFCALNLPANYVCMLEEGAGILRASVAVQALQEVFVRKGGSLLEHHKVEQIQPGHTVRVITSKGVLTAPQVVITAGPWTSHLVKPLGLKLPLKLEGGFSSTRFSSTLKLVPEDCVSWSKVIRVDALYWAATDPELVANCHKLPVFVELTSQEPHHYGLPAFEYPGLLKICSSTGPTVDPDKRDLDQRSPSIPDVATFIQKHLKGIDLVPSIVEHCLYTMTPDENPFIDKHPNYANIIMASGFSGRGFKLAPVYGKLLAELALGRKTSYSLAPFRISRFPNSCAKPKL